MDQILDSMGAVDMNKKYGLALCMAILMALWTPGFAWAYNQDQQSPVTLQTSEDELDLGSGWSVNYSFIASDIHAAAKGRSGYMAVGDRGTMLRSQDGVNWSLLSPLGDYDYSLIAASGDRYVVFGFENSGYGAPFIGFYSDGGFTWEPVTLAKEAVVYDVIGGRDMFVAVTDKGLFMSKDGSNWKIVHKPFGTHVDYINNRFIVYDVEHSQYLVSSDGTNWTDGSFPKNSYIEFGAYINGKYVAFSYNAIYISADLRSWEEVKNPPSNISYTQVTPYMKGYLLFGKGWNDAASREEMVAYYTEDGITWTKKSLSGFPYTEVFVFADGNGLVGLGMAEEDALYGITSKDGSAWTGQLVGVRETGNLAGIATNGKRTVAVGNFGVILYTDNGKDWYSAEPVNLAPYSHPNFYDVTYGIDLFVAYGSAGPYYSSDGITWNRSNLMLDYASGSIEWTGTYYVVVDQYHGVYTSKDGVNWTQGKGVKKGERPYGIVSKGDEIITGAAVYNKSNIYTQLYRSTDGAKWNKLATLPVEHALLAWNGSTFLAMDQYDSKTVWLSEDGANWQKQTAKIRHQSSITSLQSIDGLFVATNGGYVDGLFNLQAVYVSADGISWYSLDMPGDRLATFPMDDAYMNAIIKAHDSYLAVGEQGYIYKLFSLDRPIIIDIDGRVLETSADKGYAYIENGVTYLPLRLVGEAMGYEVVWNQSTRSVTYKKGTQVKEFSDVQIRKGRTYVPLRKVAEELGYEVGYERQNDTEMITIHTR